jgi:hypothetical protein
MRVSSIVFEEPGASGAPARIPYISLEFRRADDF